MEAHDSTTISPQLVEPPVKTAPLCVVSAPLVAARAPRDFQRLGCSLDRLRAAYGVRRIEALQMVLAAICEELYGEAPRAGRPLALRRKPVQSARAAVEQVRRVA